MIAGAVYVSDVPLMEIVGYDNVIITPHLAGWTADCLRRLRLARLEEQMTAARKQAAEETDPDRRKAALERVMRLNAEMTKLKQPNRMKGADLI